MGEKKRVLANHLEFELSDPFVKKLSMVAPGILAFEVEEFETYKKAEQEIEALTTNLAHLDLSSYPLIILCNDSIFL